MLGARTLAGNKADRNLKSHGAFMLGEETDD